MFCNLFRGVAAGEGEVHERSVKAWTILVNLVKACYVILYPAASYRASRIK